MVCAAIILFSGLAYIFFSMSADPASKAQNERILIIGNSFTYQNNLEKITEELVETQSVGRRSVEAFRIAFGGYRLFDHIDDLDENEPTSNINDFLEYGPDEVKDWDLVVLQEQVEIPGLPTFDLEKSRSIDSAIKLGRLADKTGAKVMILETWGNAFDPADPSNPYPEFSEMQLHLSVASVDLADALIDEQIPADIAPAGEAFLTVYNDVLLSGGNPYDPDSWFMLLYAEDREHASIAGSYLAAAVITASYTSTPVKNVEWGPPDIEPDFAAYLRQVADRAVFGEPDPEQ